MRKISGHVVATRPISLSRAAKLISRFAAVDNGSSPAVSLYLQRTYDAFNQLVQFHDKRPKTRNPDNNPDQISDEKLQIDGVEKGLDGGKGKNLEKGFQNTVDNLNEMKPEGDVANDLETQVNERKKKKKKKRKKSDDADLKEMNSSGKKKSREEAVDSYE